MTAEFRSLPPLTTANQPRIDTMTKDLVLEGQELLYQLDEALMHAAMDRDEERYNRLDDVWHKAMTRYERRYYAWKGVEHD